MLDDVQLRYVAKVYSVPHRSAVTLLRMNFTLPNPVIADAVIPTLFIPTPVIRVRVLDLAFTNLDQFGFGSDRNDSILIDGNSLHA